MSVPLLYIRAKQLKRILSDYFSGAVFLIAITSLLTYYAYNAYQKTPDSFYLTGAMVLICFAVQSYRKDKAFVYKYLQQPQLQLYFEYALLTLPFALPSLFSFQWYYFPLLQASLYLITFSNYTPPQRTVFKSISNYLPAYYFEWIAGIRTNYALLIPLYILLLGVSRIKIAPLILMWILSFSITSFYNEFESITLLKAEELTAKKFLHKKLRRHLGLLVLLYTPILLINAMFNPDFWIINGLFLLVQLSLLCFTICLKYKSYTPDKNTFANSLLLSMVGLGAILPYLLPVPLILSFVYYFKARTNLATYLHGTY